MNARLRPLPGFLLLLLPLPMTSAGSSLPPEPEHAGHVGAEREHTFNVAVPLAEAFTFFEPAGEKRWAENWHPVFATAADATLHTGSVFTVAAAHAPGHADGAAPPPSVWIVDVYAPPDRVEYRNVIPGVRTSRIVVRCEAAGARTTRVTVRYVYTGLSAAGDAAITAMNDEAFARFIGEWSAAIDAYLARGTPATP